MIRSLSVELLPVCVACAFKGEITRLGQASTGPEYCVCDEGHYRDMRDKSCKPCLAGMDCNWQRDEFSISASASYQLQRDLEADETGADAAIRRLRERQLQPHTELGYVAFPVTELVQQTTIDEPREEPILDLLDRYDPFGSTCDNPSEYAHGVCEDFNSHVLFQCFPNAAAHDDSVV